MVVHDDKSESSTLLVTKEKQAVLFERGFKTWCENISVTIRKRLGLLPSSPLSPYVLAEKLGVEVWKLEDVPDLAKTTYEHLVSQQGDEWSAVTVVVNDKHIIITNPKHSLARQSSNLMHELAHIIKKHNAAQMFMSQTGYMLRSFDEKQEAEADWFAGTLLLPRTVLSHCIYMRIPAQQVLQDYFVSKVLYQYRVRMTGVNRQYRRFA